MRQAVAALFVILGFAPRAAATGFTDLGQDIEAHTEADLELHGQLRLRAELLHNLDLDRGLTPSGSPLFPVPLSDPTAQTLTHFDMRLRADFAAYAPGQGLAVKVRLDLLDNVGLGSLPDGVPSATSSQRSPSDVVHVERAYGEVLTPLGVLAAGRMGSQWGLGMLANGGDCADCDGGDSADRVAFVTPVAGLVWAAAFDLSSSGPFVPRANARRTVDLDPADDALTLTFAVLSFRGDRARTRRQRAGKSTFDWGAYASHRWQSRDVPGSYIPTAQPVPLTPAQSMARGFRAIALDGWARFTAPWGRLEAEVALLAATIDQASLVPGALYRDPVQSLQLGAALETDIGDPDGPFGVGLDAGYASGDPAPGFGAFPAPGQTAPRPGDLDGPQATPPADTRVDNFRFHPDYRVDRILFREIIGTVTDAVYLRPHVRVRIARAGPGELAASLAAVASWAVEPNSAPGGESPLGVEIDPTIAYVTRDGLSAVAEYAVLFPLGGLANAAADLSPRPAQLFRVRLGMVF